METFFNPSLKSHRELEAISDKVIFRMQWQRIWSAPASGEGRLTSDLSANTRKNELKQRTTTALCNL